MFADSRLGRVRISGCTLVFMRVATKPAVRSHAISLFYCIEMLIRGHRNE
jgi:hypothetical protein